MRWGSKLIAILVALSFWHCSSGRPPGGNTTGFMRFSERAAVIPEQERAVTLRAATVNIDVQQVTESRETFEFTGFEKRFQLRRERVEPIPGKGLIWYGTVNGRRGSSAILVRIGNTLTGNIDTVEGEAYQIRYVADVEHTFRQIDRGKFPDEATPLPAVPPSGPLADTCATDPPSEIDVLVAYTTAARTAAGGQSAMEGSVYLAVAETNQSYINSNVTQRLRLVHTVEVAYAESGNFNTDLTRLQNGSDTFMDNVPVLRNTHAADVVSLITETGNACGLGYFMATVSNAFENSAYSVAMRSCATGYFSFGHELGHNMSADHDAANSSGGGPYPYNHGWFDTTPSAGSPWRTIMAYQTSPASTRVKYWSNPSVNYPVGNDPMGDAATADNHRVLNNTALTVANFRCSSPSATNVWMKDTWNDTGLEPDPATASEPMWISPYIWVRLAQDVGLTNQHIHENPEFGSTNWAYVKLHNGGSTSASGALELWLADASASLSWPGGWTQIASIPVSGFTAHSSRVVEAAWNPPGAGHYCMIARWNSAADPMTTPEGSDINANVRANNNLVWRNLNIVTPDPLDEASMLVFGIEGKSIENAIAILPGRGHGLTSWFAVGETIVTLDEPLLRGWIAGGQKGSGFRRDGNHFVITNPEGVRFDSVLLAPGEGGKLNLTFRRLTTTPKAEFRVDVQQSRRVVYEGRFEQVQVVGGVSYEIHTDR